MSSLAKKAFWVIVGDVATKGFGFLATIYLARVLGAGMYGLIAVGLSTIGYLMWIADLGLSNIGIREMAKSAEQRSFRAKEIFISKLILGLIVFIGAIIILPFTGLDELQASVIQMYLFAALPYAISVEWIYNGKQEYGKLAFIKSAQTGLYLLLVYLLVSNPDDVTMVPKLYLATTIFSSVLLLILLRSISFIPLAYRSFRSVSDLLKKGSYVGFGGFFSQTVNLLPPIVIGYFISLEGSGYFAAAFKIILIMMILDKVFVTLLIPALSKQWSDNEEAAKLNIAKSFRVLLFIGFLSTLLVLQLSGVLVDFIFGDEYASSIPLLQILSFFIAFTFINSLFSFGLISISKERTYLNATFKGGILAVILIIAAGISERIELIASAVVISEFILVLFSLRAFSKHTGVKFMIPFLFSLLFSIGLSFIPQFVPQLILAIALSLVLFTGIMFSFRIVTWSDIKWLNERLF